MNTKLKTVKLVEPVPRNVDLNMTPNRHMYTICGGQEVADGVIADQDVKTFRDFLE